MGGQALVRPWWEQRGSGGAIPCRDASAHADSGCVTHIVTQTDCSTVLDEDGEPLRKCVKIYRRYIQCNGSPVKAEEQTEELVARGESAQTLEPHLAELPYRLGSSAAAGTAAAAAPYGAGLNAGAGGVEAAAASAPCMEDVVNSMEQFLRWAEELQEEMAPGTVHLDQVPSAAARPNGEAGAPQQQQQQQQQQAGEEQQGGPAGGPELLPLPAPLGWLGGLLFGKRRGEAGADSSGGRQPRPPVHPSVWREFERDFTEV